MRRQFKSFTLLIFLLSTLWIWLIRGGMVCPAGWSQHAQSCFAMFTRPKATWSDAVHLCRDFGSELAIPLTSEENDFIWNLFRAQNLTAAYITPIDSGLWLGCRRSGPNVTWECAKTQTLLFARWKEGRPDGRGDCMVMWYNKAKWSDVKCDKTRFTVCERRLIDCPRCGRCIQVGPAGQCFDCPSNRVLKEVSVRNPMHCCFLCTNDPLCRSFNLRDNNCQLNIVKRPDLTPSKDLMSRTTCAYYEMSYISLP